MKQVLTGMLALTLTAAISYGDGAAADQHRQGVSEWMALPEQRKEAQSDAVKRVMLERMIRLKEEKHRLSRENSEHCLKRAKELGAPPAFVNLLEKETAGTLMGREVYVHNEEMKRLLLLYGVDELQVRLFVEDMKCSAAEAFLIAAWLPVHDVFEVVPEKMNMDEKEMRQQLTVLREVYGRMADVYKDVKNRETAEAAAESLLPLLSKLRPTASLRCILSRIEKDRVPLYREIVVPAKDQLVRQRALLRESNFYGSHRLAALDSLLCA